MIWSIAGVVVLASAVLLWFREVAFWRVVAVLAVATYGALWAAYGRGRTAAWVRAFFAREVPVPRRTDPPDLYERPFPRRLGWNWAAFVLGPFWYLIQGLWVHGVILLSLAFVSGGILLPLVWLYAALKADEDLLEFRIARRSVY